jgi:hypothetical protein
MSLRNGYGPTKFMKIVLLVLAIGCGIAIRAAGESSVGGAGLTNEVSPFGRAVYKAATWGAQTNGIEFGARISSVGPHPSDQLKVFTYLGNTRSTNRYGLLIPPHGCRLDLSLRDKNGNEVPRTRTGNALCKAVPSGLRYKGYPCSLVPGAPTRFDDPFDVRDCFKVKEPGTYLLTLKPRLYALKKPYPDYERVDLPATQVNIILREADLEPSQ